MTLEWKSESGRAGTAAAPRGRTSLEGESECPTSDGKQEAREVSRRTVLGLAATYLFRHHVVVVDVSSHGVGVESHRPVPFAGHGKLRLEVAGQIREWEVSLRWCRLARTRCLDGECLPVYAAGFRLLGGSGSFAEDLSQAVVAKVDAAIDADRTEARSAPWPGGSDSAS